MVELVYRLRNSVLSAREIEKRVYRHIDDHSTIILVCLLILIGATMRFVGWNVVSRDYTYFLGPWYNKMKAIGAIDCLKTQIGNYNIPYQEIILILTRLPISAPTGYKLVSCFFDIVLAIATGMLVHRMQAEHDVRISLLAGSVVFALPVVAINSSWWAQCDSIWASLCILSLVAYLDRRYALTFILYGAALGFKLQAIFLMPFWLVELIHTKRFSILNFLLIPLTMVFLSFPSIFAGRNPMDIVNVYIAQSSEKHGMYLNFPSFWGLFVSDANEHSDLLKKMALLITFGVLTLESLYIMKTSKTTSSGSSTVMVAILLVFSAVLFLPSMHERYAYLVEVVLVSPVFIDLRFALPAVILQLLSLKTYIYYFCSTGSAVWHGTTASMAPLSAINLFAFSVVLILTFKYLKLPHSQRSKVG